MVAEGNKIALLHSQYCRNCLAEPKNFHNTPGTNNRAEVRNREAMFSRAMSNDFDNSSDKVVRLRQHNWFSTSIHMHPFQQPGVPITFDPYKLPRCVEHDFSEGIVEFLITEIFRSSIGRNLAERAHNCQYVAQALDWCPGLSHSHIVKIATVSFIIILNLYYQYFKFLV